MPVTLRKRVDLLKMGLEGKRDHNDPLLECIIACSLPPELKTSTMIFFNLEKILLYACKLLTLYVYL